MRRRHGTGERDIYISEEGEIRHRCERGYGTGERRIGKRKI